MTILLLRGNVPILGIPILVATLMRPLMAQFKRNHDDFCTWYAQYTLCTLKLLSLTPVCTHLYVKDNQKGRCIWATDVCRLDLILWPLHIFKRCPGSIKLNHTDQQELCNILLEVFLSAAGPIQRLPECYALKFSCIGWCCELARWLPRWIKYYI